MKKNIVRFIMLFTFLGIASSMLVSCSQDVDIDSPYVGPDEPSKAPDNDFESTVLIYAVATNSLKANLIYDKREILEAAPAIDLEKNNVLIFQTNYKIDEDNSAFTTDGEVSLIKLVKRSGEYGWETVKEYPQDIASLNPERMAEVIQYVKEEYHSKSYGLMFWSHSTGSQPYVSTKSFQEDAPMTYSFGQDLTTPEPEYEQMNIDDMASVLPDNLFRFIWFDSCYMSNIESIYQLRNKCEVYVGYATEVCDDGTPYQRVLPYLTSSTPDILGAAVTFFNYYDKEYAYRMATIAVTDMSKIERIAEFCKNVYTPASLSSVSSLHKYTRYSTGPFYDLGDYTKAMAALNGEEVSDEEWTALLDDCLIYRAATPYDFSGKAIDPVKYSGISTHIYNFESTATSELYYQSLDWFKTVF